MGIPVTGLVVSHEANPTLTLTVTSYRTQSPSLPSQVEWVVGVLAGLTVHS